MSELKPRRVRANAFDLSRTDVEEADGAGPAPSLSEILPRVTDLHTTPTAATPTRDGSTSAPRPARAAVPAGSPVTPIHQRTTDDAAPTTIRRLDPSTGPNPADPAPRGVGGRPAGAGSTTRRITATAARVPIALYDRAEDLVKGRGKPSWGQLIAWTCKTRQQEVIDEVLTLTRPPDGLVPRGQNKRGTASTQITARFTWDERETFTLTREVAQAAAATAQAQHAENVTATLVVIAALEVATTPT